MSQAALFDAQPIAGLEYRDEFISAVEHDRLVAKLSATDLAPFRFHGWLGNRKTKTFGWRYDFDDSSFTAAEPIPEWLEPLRAKAAALAGITPEEFAHVLLARYDPGAGIGWHRDRPQFQHVVGISLGNPATLRLRRRTERGFERAAAELAPRSIYHMAGEVRHDWEHSITPIDLPRWSITFRSLSEKGRALVQR